MTTSNSWEPKAIFDAPISFREMYLRDDSSGVGSPGSSPENTNEYRHYLSRFLQSHNIRIVLDLGCGDWAFSKLIDWTGVQYIGIDVVPEIIRANLSRYGREGIEFQLLDGMREPLPPADLILIKDVLQHWPNADIIEFIPKLKSYKYALITNDTASSTMHCTLPGLNAEEFINLHWRYRPVDISLPPFEVESSTVLEYSVWGTFKEVKLVSASDFTESLPVTMKIPNIYHFAFGFSADFGGKPFSLIHYLAIASCHAVNKPDSIHLYYHHEPSGIWWERAQKFICAMKVDPPHEIFGNPIYHPAHMTDVFRLKILLEHGGVYLDMDVICVKPFQPLFGYDVVLGDEPGVGLCNAVILAKPGARFLHRWLASYESFNHDLWNNHSVIVPRRLAREMPADVKVLDSSAFFSPMYWPEQLRSFFEERTSEFTKKSYCVHLWEQASWDKYLRQLTSVHLHMGDSEFCRISKRYLPAPTQASEIRLRLGSGGWRSDGSLTVNRTQYCNIHHEFFALDEFILSDGIIDEFILEHSLNRVPGKNYVIFLKNLYAKLKPGGRVIVKETDAATALSDFASGNLSWPVLRRALFASPEHNDSDSDDYCRYTMSSEKEVELEFRKLGFVTKTFDAGGWRDKTDDLDVRNDMFVRNFGIVASKPIL